MLSTTPANLSLCRSSEPRQVKHAMPHAGAPNQAGPKEFELSAVAPTSCGTDKTITLRARADASVADLKGQLATKCGLAADDLSLTWGSKPLWRDGFTLGEYGLRGGATLVATGRGGGMPTASELRDAFAKFDANGDGYLSVEELVGVFTRPVNDGEPITEEQARAYVAKHDKNGDGRLDLDEFAAALVAEQVEQPLQASHFREQGRLTLLVLGTAGGDSTASGATTAGADIRLLSAHKLIAHIDDGGQMVARQKLEATATDVFADAATVRAVLKELETRDDKRCTFSGVTALSYAWVRLKDPDPQRAQLEALRPVLVWYMCERARRKRGHGRWRGDATMQTADFGIFMDFMCMFQPDDTTGATPSYTKPAEREAFGRALSNIGLFALSPPATFLAGGTSCASCASCACHATPPRGTTSTPERFVSIVIIVTIGVTFL